MAVREIAGPERLSGEGQRARARRRALQRPLERAPPRRAHGDRRAAARAGQRGGRQSPALALRLHAEDLPPRGARGVTRRAPHVGVGVVGARRGGDVAPLAEAPARGLQHTRARRCGPGGELRSRDVDRAEHERIALGAPCHPVDEQGQGVVHPPAEGHRRRAERAPGAAGVVVSVLILDDRPQVVGPERHGGAHLRERRPPCRTGALDAIGEGGLRARRGRRRGGVRTHGAVRADHGDARARGHRERTGRTGLDRGDRTSDAELETGLAVGIEGDQRSVGGAGEHGAAGVDRGDALREEAHRRRKQAQRDAPHLRVFRRHFGHAELVGDHRAGGRLVLFLVRARLRDGFAWVIVRVRRRRGRGGRRRQRAEGGAGRHLFLACLDAASGVLAHHPQLTVRPGPGVGDAGERGRAATQRLAVPLMDRAPAHEPHVAPAPAHEIRAQVGRRGEPPPRVRGVIPAQDEALPDRPGRAGPVDPQIGQVFQAGGTLLPAHAVAVPHLSADRVVEPEILRRAGRQLDVLERGRLAHPADEEPEDAGRVTQGVGERQAAAVERERDVLPHRERGEAQ